MSVTTVNNVNERLAAVVKELDRQLTLNESILRTKVIRPDMR